MSLIPGVAELQQENVKLQEQIDKIEVAIENVNTALSRMKSNEDAGHSYNWIIENVDTYWTVVGNNSSSVRTRMIEDLTTLRDDFASGGNLEASVGDVTGAAGRKIDELNTQIEANNAQIDALIQEYQDSIAEESDTEEETKISDASKQGITRTKETK